MTEYAKITADLQDTGRRKRNIDPVPKGGLAPGKPYWVPVVEEVSYTSTPGAPTVVSPWVETVEAARVLRTRSIRDKTPAELAAEDSGAVESAFEGTGIDRALARVLFAHENRLRVLEGAPEISAAQFKAALVGLVR